MTTFNNTTIDDLVTLHELGEKIKSTTRSSYNSVFKEEDAVECRETFLTVLKNIKRGHEMSEEYRKKQLSKDKKEEKDKDPF